MIYTRTRALPASGAFQPLLVIANRLAGPGLLFLLMVFAFWRILLTDQYSWLNGYDMTSQVMPWLQFQAGEWHAGRIPLWSPYEWGGQNLIGQAQPGVVNPLNWLLFAAPLRRGWIRQGVLHWWFFLLHFIGALNLYWLCRSFGTGRIPAVFGGLCFGLLGFLGSNDWPQMICGVIWAPLVFLFLFRSSRGTRPWSDAAWGGLFFGLTWLSGHHQLPIFVSLGAAGTAIALRLYPAILTFAVGGLIAAPQLLTGLAYGRLAVRWVGMENTVGWKDAVAYYVHEQYANPPAALLSILLPGAETHTSYFLGATALVLALWALRTQWARLEIRVLFSMGLLALLYSLGRMGGVEGVLYSLVPLVEKARSPSMAGALFTLAFAVLAAIGLEAQRLKPCHPVNERLHWLFGGGVIALFTLAKLFPGNASQLEQRWFSVALVSLLLGFAYRAARTGNIAQRHLVPLLLFAILIEAANMSYFNMGNRHDKNTSDLLTPMSKHLDAREFLAGLPGPVRVTVDDKAIPFNFGDWHGVEVMGGYLASLQKTRTEVDWFSPRGLQLAGVGYHVGPAARAEGSKLLFAGADGVNVWRYPRDPLPRVWLVSGTMQYQGAAQFGQFVETETIDLSQVALVEKPIAGLGGCSPGEAALLRHDAGEVEVITRSGCRALLVIGDSDDPGWRVSVDGVPAERLTVFHALRGVVVPEGDHRIRWTYSPEGFRAGVAASVLGIAVLFMVPWWERRRAAGAA